MTPQAIIGWNNQVPIGYKPGSMSFMNFPREIRDQIYEDMLEEPQMTQYFKERGWQLSHKFNFAVLRLSKQVHKELSEIVYAKLWLVLPVIRIWGPEWANLNLGLPGTTHIRYCRIDFQILITYHRRQDRDTCKDGIMALIVDLVKTLSQLPNLEKLQVTHTGLVNYRLSNRIDPLDLEWEMNGFNFLKGLQRILPLGGSLDGPCYYTVLEFFKGMWRTGMRKHPRTDFQVEFRIRRQQDKLPSMTDSWEWVIPKLICETLLIGYPGRSRDQTSA